MPRHPLFRHSDYGYGFRGHAAEARNHKTEENLIQEIGLFRRFSRCRCLNAWPAKKTEKASVQLRAEMLRYFLCQAEDFVDHDDRTARSSKLGPEIRRLGPTTARTAVARKRAVLVSGL